MRLVSFTSLPVQSFRRKLNFDLGSTGLSSLRFPCLTLPTRASEIPESSRTTSFSYSSFSSCSSSSSLSSSLPSKPSTFMKQCSVRTLFNQSGSTTPRNESLQWRVKDISGPGARRDKETDDGVHQFYVPSRNEDGSLFLCEIYRSNSWNSC